jgi:hypothetical protein
MAPWWASAAPAWGRRCCCRARCGSTDLPSPPERGSGDPAGRDHHDRPAGGLDRLAGGRRPGRLLGVPGVVGGDDYASLAIRDLQRGQGVGLPSGEALARRLGVEPLTPEEVGLGPLGWWLEAPLWFYLLKEAEHRGGGERLGPVGGRLVGEVLVGIVDADGESYRAVDPGWRPTLPAAQAGRFGMADLLAFSAQVADAAA